MCDIEMLTRVTRPCGRSTLVGLLFRCGLPLLEIAPASSYRPPYNLKQDDIEYAIENTAGYSCAGNGRSRRLATPALSFISFPS